jgi:hypothetical protein
MLIMTEKKKPRPGKKPERPERARDRGEVKLLTVEITLEHDRAIESAARQTRLKRRALVELALEQYFAGLGLWPPPAEDHGRKGAK